MIHIEIDASTQFLSLIEDGVVKKHYQIATATKGLGEESGSEKTPRGWHSICAKIGGDQPINTVFVGRCPTGEIYSDMLAQQYPDRDWILTRILWLSGLDVSNANTRQRYIYIHGCPDNVVFGEPSSHGCIRMHNKDVMDLFDEVSVDTRVWIGTKESTV